MAIDTEGYMEALRERKKTTRVYQKHQMTGLLLAEILHDERHKALYIKLAKQHPEQKLMELAKRVAETQGVENKGAYFMRILHADGKDLENGQ